MSADLLADLAAGLPIPTPSTRAGCSELPRPCPATSCRYHLAQEVAQVFARPRGKAQLEVAETGITDTCALDIANDVEAEARGAGRQVANDAVVGRKIGRSREQVRKIEHTARLKVLGDEVVAELGEQAGAATPEVHDYGSAPPPSGIAYLAINVDLAKRLREHVGSEGGNATVTAVFEAAVELVIDPDGAAERLAERHEALRQYAAKLRAKRKKVSKPRLIRPDAIDEVVGAGRSALAEQLEASRRSLAEVKAALVEERVRRELAEPSREDIDQMPKSGDQIVKEREALGWARSKLAREAGVNVKTLKKLEDERGTTSPEVRAKVEAAIERGSRIRADRKEPEAPPSAAEPEETARIRQPAEPVPCPFEMPSSVLEPPSEDGVEEFIEARPRVERSGRRVNLITAYRVVVLDAATPDDARIIEAMLKR